MFPLRKLLFTAVLIICVCACCLGSLNVYKARILSSKFFSHQLRTTVSLYSTCSLKSSFSPSPPMSLRPSPPCRTLLMDPKRQRAYLKSARVQYTDRHARSVPPCRPFPVDPQSQRAYLKISRVQCADRRARSVLSPSASAPLGTLSAVRALRRPLMPNLPNSLATLASPSKVPT